MTAETSLVLLVPEAEPLVEPFRDRHDPAAAAGMPAHITLLYPFKAPAAIDRVLLDGLSDFFRSFPPFAFSLAAIGRFPATLYLALEPAEPFRTLTRAIWQRHPDTPPYGGRYADIVPHLSFADRLDERRLEQIRGEFAAASAGKLPIHAHATEITLMDNGTGRWRVTTTFRLGR